MDLLLSYRPFASWGTKGLKKASAFGRLPFEDASIRTEPNLRHEAPSVSSLCRGDLVVGRVEVGSHLVYVTVKRRFKGHSDSVQFLTAILRVQAKLANHEEAYRWYAERGLDLPRNCILVEPLPAVGALFGYNPVAGREFTCEEAESKYKQRAVCHPSYLLCENLFPTLLEQPRLVTLESLGISPKATQVGKKLLDIQLQQFIAIARATD